MRRSSTPFRTSSPTINRARLLGPEPVLRGREGCAGFRQLECADDAAPVVRVNRRRGGGIESGELLVRRGGTRLVVEPLAALASARTGRRRQRQLCERRAQ